MSNHHLKTLISKLNDTSRAAATRAAAICVSLGQYEVEIEHLLLALLEQERCDFALIVRASDISPTALQADLQREVATFRSGSARTPVLSRRLPLLLEHAWLIASLAAQPATIRSRHLLLALLTEAELSQLAQRCSPLFARISIEQLKHHPDKLTAGSQEQDSSAMPSSPPADPLASLAGAARSTPALDQFTADLTQLARDGKLDPVVGREREIRQAVDILLRRRQNNPILTGEAGVGKTAVVEGLALRIAAGDVPAVLQGAHIHTLDMGLLQAGASVKGEFESRLKNVIDEVAASAHPVILFIDEAHTMIGAGGQAGQNDAANLLKPALARGALRTIAATTWSEYKKYFEKDAALARRFQVVKVEEPDADIACAMLRAMAPLMERHFGLRVRDDAIVAAVRLSQRYLSGRQLPDKAVSVLDTACAQVALGQNATPAQLEDCACRLQRLGVEVAALEREAASGEGNGAAPARLALLQAQLATGRAEADALAQRWHAEKALVAQITALRAELRHERPGEAGAARLLALKNELAALQGAAPLAPLEVDGQAVAGIVAGWTGIPPGAMAGAMADDELRGVLSLEAALRERVLGQQHVIEAVAQRIRTARAGLGDPDKPQAVFLFTGPSGTGKTETALALAELLYGGQRKLITINMSEYQEAHSVAGLKGSPPGYVGYGEGGVLSEAVRRQPYSVLLLDEVEKAHPDVLELFYQVFDKGVLDDSEGRQIDFRHTVIIATSNLGSAAIMAACLNQPPETLPTPAMLQELLRAQLVRHFKPALLGRMTVLPFYPLDDTVLAQIVEMKLARIGRRLAASCQARFSHDAALADAVLARCTEVDSGARNIDQILEGSVLPGMASALLARLADALPVSEVHAGVDAGGQFVCTLN
ncbi:type VI secretion system ATPase TssH [Janthinobacterium aquaticum]|uniref:type VI secretion system ATPase TssH n=1 Tax=Janthinobacterium sp. FT58W TaxID=2654254 RepID=UPI0012647A3D|nr:type VI secretion system ATPase TssH [Janthinobacterium sp. FT58W]KAB8042436.1 type VI secretion system ATPase TssH [Janthinobacterium sp. FT58W]